MRPIAILRLEGSVYDGRWYAVSQAETARGFEASIVIYLTQPTAEEVRVIETSLERTKGRSFLIEDLLKAAGLPTSKAPR